MPLPDGTDEVRAYRHRGSRPRLARLTTLTTVCSIDTTNHNERKDNDHLHSDTTARPHRGHSWSQRLRSIRAGRTDRRGARRVSRRGHGRAAGAGPQPSHEVDDAPGRRHHSLRAGLTTTTTPARL